MVTAIVNNASRGRDLLDHGIAAVEYSSCGMLLLHGKETLDFLQRISTNDLRACVPGTAVQTVFVSEKAKIVDAVIVLATTDGALLLTGPGSAPQVKVWLERYIIMEDITIEDVTGRGARALVLGDGGTLTAAFPPRELPVLPEGNASSIHFSFFSRPAVLLSAIDADAVHSILDASSIPFVTADVFDAFRVAYGIPLAGREITAESNPLEAGLKRIVSFTKGCYIGQEVISRLETYKKVQRLLCRVRLTPCPQPEMGAEIIGENGVHGYITTISPDRADGGPCDALAILRSPVVGALFTMNNGTVGVRVEELFE